MKIRNGFVSNSSSSSFVIAVRNDCTKDDIVKTLLNEKKALNNFIKNDLEYISENYDEFNGLDGEELEVAVAKVVADEIFSSFYKSGGKYEYFLRLGEWEATAEEYSSESDRVVEIFVYQELGSIDTEKFKIKSTGN